MRIISKFHDYYDTAAGLGIDKTLIYKRINEKFKLANRVGFLSEGYQPVDPYLKHLTLNNWKDKQTFMHMLPIDHFFRWDSGRKNDIDVFIIGFCGKEYLGIRYEPRIFEECRSEPTFFYGNEMVEFLKLLYEKEYKPKTISEKENLKRKVKDLVEFINQIHGRERIEKFIEYKIPIYLEQVGYLEKNPILGSYDFFKVFDSFSAFQEVSMFMGGVLGKGEPKTILIDEKYRQVQAGLDKWSFRNPDPPKRKQKK